MTAKLADVNAALGAPALDALTRAFLAEYREVVALVEAVVRQPVNPEARRRFAQDLLGRWLFRRFAQETGQQGSDSNGPCEEALAPAGRLLERYPFTAAEPAPDDVAVAIDPAVLGTVFEQSLPGRYERGAYYTPRPLVTFMCREALKCYLAESADAPAVAHFVDAGDPGGLPDPAAVLGALRRVQVCDPACGAGAFLLGMLHELDRLSGALSAPLAARRRLEIVRNNLHGLDLEPRAVEIARRRLWLAVAAADGATPDGNDLGDHVRTGDGLTADTGVEGFDIVLTNPPYVRMELLKSLRPVLRREFPEVHAVRADLYVYFYARAQRLLREGGIGCFLSSNKWLRAGYGEGLRRHLLDAQAVRLVVDFGELPVFRAATFPAVVLWQKRPRGDAPTRWATVTDLRGCYEEGVRQHVERRARTLPAVQFGRDRPRLLAPAVAERRRRMEASGPRLGEVVGGRLCRGIVTGFNAAFLVDRPTRDRLLADDPASAAVLRPLLTGDDVRRYEVHDRGIYLLYLTHGIDVGDYPAVRRHLAPFRPRLERRATRQAWFELQQPQAAYVPFFEADKIVYPVIGKAGRFALDAEGYYQSDKVFLIPSADWYLLGVLNSTPALEYLRGTCSVLGDEGAGGRLEFRKIHVTTLPVPEAAADERAAVAALARRAQELHAGRRQRVEDFLRAVGRSPAELRRHGPLERPWELTACQRGRLGPAAVAAHDDTRALNADIDAVEAQIDRRVAGLYGLA
jgi:methylase of polypeptide subunit release factors